MCVAISTHFCLHSYDQLFELHINDIYVNYKCTCTCIIIHYKDILVWFQGLPGDSGLPGPRGSRGNRVNDLIIHYFKDVAIRKICSYTFHTVYFRIITDIILYQITPRPVQTW